MKNSKSIFWSILLLVITCFYACEEEITTENNKTEILETTFKKESISDQLTGGLQSTNGKPIENAIIKLKEETIGRSDAEGHFVLKENKYAIGDVLTVNHTDYITASIVIEQNKKLFLLMKERAKVYIINSEKGAEISVEHDGQITIPANAFSYKGELYKGSVAIRATYIDVTDSSELRSAPGSYIAQKPEGGDLYPLTSFGMLEITATIPEKNIPLELSEGNVIDASFPIRTENTPEEVNLYELNTATGYWDISGTLVNQGNVLRGEITSVNSAWNADESCADTLVCVRVQVLYTNGDPGCYIWATGLSYNGFSGHFVPDANGFVELWVCPNSIFQLNACLCLCIPGGPIQTNMIDLTSVTMNPSGCTDLGVWTINN